VDWLEEQIRNLPRPDTIVHVGAGLCSELDAWRGTGAGRIVLVEPNPELLPELRRRTAEDERVEILPFAVAAEGGEGTLQVFNLSEVSSLREPTGLRALLPGLEIVDQHQVETITIDELLEKIASDPEGENWLVVEAPGEEAVVIEYLEEGERLQWFDRIILRAGRATLYEGARSAEELVNDLDGQGYFKEGAIDLADADWPRYHFRLNPKAVECRRLIQESQALVEERDSLQQRLEEQSSRARKAAEEQQAELELQKKAYAELERRFSKTEETAKAEKQALTEERDTLAKRLKEQNIHARKAVEDQQAELKRYERAYAELQRQLKETQETAESEKKALAAERDSFAEQIEGVSVSVKNMEDKLASKTNELKKQQETIQSLERELESTREQASQHRSDLQVALRLQNLRENDLKELQKRYGELRETTLKQRELLGNLHQRLSAAAEYLQLAHENPDEEIEVQEGLLRMLSGEHAPRD